MFVLGAFMIPTFILDGRRDRQRGVYAGRQMDRNGAFACRGKIRLRMALSVS